MMVAMETEGSKGVKTDFGAISRLGSTLDMGVKCQDDS